MENMNCCETKEACTIINQYYGCDDGILGGTLELVDNLEETEIGKALDATMGKVLDDKIAEVDNSLSDLSNQLSELSKKGVYSSSNEVEIGTWIDGKPIYRMVLQGITPAQAAKHIVFANLSSLNIDKMTHIHGIVESSNGAYQALVPHSCSDKGTVMLEIVLWYEKASKNLCYNLVGTDYASGPLYVIVDYTKI